MPQKVRMAGRAYTPGADHGVATLLTAAGWLLARLPDAVVDQQRGELIRTLAAADPLVIEIAPGTGVRIRSGDRLLVVLPAPAASAKSDPRAFTGLIAV